MLYIHQYILRKSDWGELRLAVEELISGLQIHCAPRLSQEQQASIHSYNPRLSDKKSHRCKEATARHSVRTCSRPAKSSHRPLQIHQRCHRYTCSCAPRSLRQRMEVGSITHHPFHIKDISTAKRPCALHIRLSMYHEAYMRNRVPTATNVRPPVTRCIALFHIWHFGFLGDCPKNPNVLRKKKFNFLYFAGHQR